ERPGRSRLRPRNDAEPSVSQSGIDGAHFPVSLIQQRRKRVAACKNLELIRGRPDPQVHAHAVDEYDERRAAGAVMKETLDFYVPALGRILVELVKELTPSSYRFLLL
nr:hypothetical protein [Nitrospiraceae bacterium]